MFYLRQKVDRFAKIEGPLDFGRNRPKRKMAMRKEVANALRSMVLLAVTRAAIVVTGTSVQSAVLRKMGLSTANLGPRTQKRSLAG